MNNMLEIGDIIEMTIPGSGCMSWPIGAKAEIVGTGRNNISYARFLGDNRLMELDGNGFTYYQKIEGSKVTK